MDSISSADCCKAARRHPSVARRDDDLGGEAGPGEAEAEEVLGGGEEAVDVEQRVVRDAVAEQWARRGQNIIPPVAAGAYSSLVRVAGAATIVGPRALGALILVADAHDGS